MQYDTLIEPKLLQHIILSILTRDFHVNELSQLKPATNLDSNNDLPNYKITQVKTSYVTRHIKI